MSDSDCKVVFDVFGVLLSSSFRSAASRLSALLDTPAEVIRPIYVRWEYPWDRGQITVEQFWQRVQQDLGSDADWRLLNEAVLSSIHPLAGSLELLDRCAERADTYLLSDTRREWFQVLDARYGLRRRVRRAFLSYEMGFGKAERQCFEYLVTELGGSPQSICLLDDRLPNVKMARSLGMKAIHFADAQQGALRLEELCPELRSLTILP